MDLVATNPLLLYLKERDEKKIAEKKALLASSKKLIKSKQTSRPETFDSAKSKLSSKEKEKLKKSGASKVVRSSVSSQQSRESSTSATKNPVKESEIQVLCRTTRNVTTFLYN